MTLPPGQHRTDGFPRFGTHMHRPPPPVPAAPGIEVAGAVAEPFSVPVAQLRELARRELVADFHCVSGWTATDLRWEGVPFAAFYRELVEPALRPDMAITHVAFAGLDRYRSLVLLDDALHEDVLLADTLDGRPLGGDHGAPVRLVSPAQYGFVSTKHLCRIRLYAASDRLPPPFGSTPLIQAHPRARVWQEERHRYLPARPLRPVYRLLIPPFRWLAARGSGDRRG